MFVMNLSIFMPNAGKCNGIDWTSSSTVWHMNKTKWVYSMWKRMEPLLQRNLESFEPIASIAWIEQMWFKVCWRDVHYNKYLKNWTSFESARQLNPSQHSIHCSRMSGLIMRIWFPCSTLVPELWKRISPEPANERYKDYFKMALIPWRDTLRTISQMDTVRLVHRGFDLEIWNNY